MKSIRSFILFASLLPAFTASAQIDPETGTGIVNGFYFGPGVTYRNATFNFLELADADLSNSNFISCNFIGANLKAPALSADMSPSSRRMVAVKQKSIRF